MNALELTQNSMADGEWSRRSSVTSSTYRDATLLWSALFGSDQNDVSAISNVQTRNARQEPVLNFSQSSLPYTPEYSAYRETRRYSIASDVYPESGDFACGTPEFSLGGFQYDEPRRNAGGMQTPFAVPDYPATSELISANRRNSAPALLDRGLQFCAPPNMHNGMSNCLPFVQYYPPISNAPYTYSHSNTSMPACLCDGPNEPSSIYRADSEKSVFSSSVGNGSSQQIAFLSLPANFEPMPPPTAIARSEMEMSSPGNVPLSERLPISRVESSGNISITTDVTGTRDADYYMPSPVAMLTAGVASLNPAEDSTPGVDPFGDTSFFPEGGFGNGVRDREMEDAIVNFLRSGALEAVGGGDRLEQGYEGAAGSQCSGGELTTLEEITIKTEGGVQGDKMVVDDAMGMAAQAKSSQKVTSRPRSQSDPPTMKPSVLGARGSARYNPVKLHNPMGGTEHCPYQQKVEIATVGGSQAVADTGERIECCVCGRTETPLWRVFSDGNRYCNACGLYFKAHGKVRPLRGEPAATRDGMKERAKCTSCGTENTSLWRRNEAGELVCNACGLYEKVHHKSRPVDLLKKPKTKTSRRRPRAKSSPAGPPTLPSIPGAKR